MQRDGYAIEARIRFDADADIREPGGAVTVALCGHWEHDGSCRWPHHTAIEDSSAEHRLRTVYVATPSDEPDVRARIDAALRSETAWRVDSFGPSPLTTDEQAFAARLGQT